MYFVLCIFIRPSFIITLSNNSGYDSNDIFSNFMPFDLSLGLKCTRLLYFSKQYSSNNIQSCFVFLLAII